MSGVEIITTPTTIRAGKKQWCGLAVLALPCMVYSMDLTVLNLAIPSLTADLKPTAQQTLWIVDIYGFMVAGFLIMMGAMGDKFGRRRVLLIGAGTFALTSIFASLTKSTEMLILSRALLGIAGATLAPSTLSLISVMFKHEDDRIIAMSLWISSYSVGAIIGPLLGGLVITSFSWGAVFLIGVPVMIFVLILAPFLLPEYLDESAKTPDIISILLSITAVLTLIYGLKTTAEIGLTWLAIGSFIIGSILLFIFIQRQKHLESPLIDLNLFKSSPFSLALFLNLLGMFFMFGSFIALAQYFQLVLGMSPLKAGLWSMVSAVIFTLVSFMTPMLRKFLGEKILIIAGLLVSSFGYMLLPFQSEFYGVLIASILFFTGFTPVITLTTDIIITSVPPEKAGTVSALSETSAELGGALGIALFGSLMTFVYRLQMADIKGAGTSLTTALETANSMPVEAAIVFITTAKNAFMTGFNIIGVIASVSLAMASYLAWRVFKIDNRH